MAFNFDFEFSALIFLIVVAIFFFFKEKLFSLSSVIYGVFLMVVICYLSLDVASAYMINAGTRFTNSASTAVNTVFFVFQVLSAYMFLLFSMALTNTLTLKTGAQRFRLILLSLPMIIMLIAVFINVQTGIFFYFDGFGEYCRGNLIYLFLIYAIFYIAAGLVFILRYRKAITDVQFCALLVFVGLFCFSIGLQSAFPQYLIMGVAMAIALASMYFTFKNPDDYVDKLTGLFDRNAFFVVLNQLFVSSRRVNDLSLIVVDIKDFKSVNNLFGTKAGDELLLQVGAFLSSICALRRLFRIDGDKFVLIVENKKAQRLIEIIENRFKRSWFLLGSRVKSDVYMCLIGSAIIFKNRSEIMTLLDNSIILAKKSGAGKYLHVDDIVVKKIHRRLLIENSLRNVPFSDILKIYMQPIYSVKEGRATSAEALLRMEDPLLGEVSPDEFVEIAQNRGIIRILGRYVVDSVCKFIEENRVWEYGLSRISVNLSLLEFLQDDLVGALRETVSKYDLEKTKLTLEITETAAPESISVIKEKMNAIIDFGVSFSLDDYGQGYSNSSMLISLPFRSVKLDKSMLWEMEGNEKAAVMYKNLVTMSHQMGLYVVSEGAETPQQVEYLKSIGVDYIQGFYFGRPTEAGALLNALSRH